MVVLFNAEKRHINIVAKNEVISSFGLRKGSGSNGSRSFISVSRGQTCKEVT
jgi:hypothetical protein